MSTEGGDRQQQKYREFMGLLPLTVAIAGLPDSRPGEYFNEGQMENRANTLKHAYKVARSLIQDVVQVKPAE
jgi:hypothetical protein